MKKIAFFGGSFDPIHNGHLHLIREILKRGGFNKLYISPACCSPLKDGHHATSQQRLEMVYLALEGMPPEVILSKWEIEQKGSSYTIDAIKHIQKLHPDSQIFFVASGELLSDLHRWKGVETLFKLCHPLFTCNPGDQKYLKKELSRKLSEPLREKIIEAMMEFEHLFISSSLIRANLYHQKSCNALLPAKVLDYIREKRLYFER